MITSNFRLEGDPQGARGGARQEIKKKISNIFSDNYIST